MTAAKPGPGRRPSPGRGALPPSAWRPLQALVVAALLAGALGLTLGLRGLASDQPAASPRLQALLQRAGPLVVFSEFGLTADTLWAANPDDPTERTELGRVEHAQGYGISPSLSPNGTHIAYTVLPPVPRPGSDASAELWVLETDGGATRRLAEGVDLRTTPVWSPTNDAVVVRRSSWQGGGAGSSQLLRIDLTGAAAPVATADDGLFPIDFSPDGFWLYYAILSSSGTDLARAPTLGGTAELVAHLSDGFARDWHLSPDGARLAYLGQTPVNGGFTFVAQVLDLSTGTVRTPLARAGAAQFNPVWERGGGLTIGRLDSAGGGAAVRLTAAGAVRAQAALPPPGPPSGGAGFDVPLSWSPAGAHLAVRSFEGISPAGPGPSHVVVVGTDGRRRELSPLSDIAVAGWLAPAP